MFKRAVDEEQDYRRQRGNGQSQPDMIFGNSAHAEKQEDRNLVPSALQSNRVCYARRPANSPGHWKSKNCAGLNPLPKIFRVEQPHQASQKEREHER